MLAVATSWGSVAVTEVIWTLLGVFALTVSAPNMVEAYKDLVALNFTSANGVLRVVALGNLREELLRVAKATVITGIGVAAMFTPPANPQQPISGLSLIVTAGLFVLVALVVAGSVSARRTRALVMKSRRSRKKEETSATP
jgi:hypothetical protein